ncbi:uncharacterized protein LOC141582256 [Saimiri boliviensis]|uniref:uncharacterized protein LOC141582256 n=1 Tax=Saimiri boliviensis TaxID=27679 RepID=UPI003D7808D2
MAEGSAATAAAASAPRLRAGGRGGGRPGRGERGRAAGEGAGAAAAAAAGLPRLPRLRAPRARSAAARPGSPPRLAATARPGRASSRPPGRRSASPFLLRLRLLPHKYQLLSPSPDLAAAAAATLCSDPASRDFRAGLSPPRLTATRPLVLSLLLLCQSICPLATEAPPTCRAPPGLGPVGPGAGPPARALAGRPVARDVSAPPPPLPPATASRRSVSRGSRPPRCNSHKTRCLGPGPHSGAGCRRCSRRLGSRCKAS